MLKIGHALIVIFVAALLMGGTPISAEAASASAIDRSADRTLKQLYRKIPAAESLARDAKAVLVFPSVTKGGFMVGAQYGEGALRKGGKTVGYYRTTAVSYGLQAGAQRFGYVLFFMTDSAVKHLDQSDGWEIGVGPSVVVVDEGMGKSATTKTLDKDIYAFIFSQQGLMAGIGIQGNKISKLDK